MPTLLNERGYRFFMYSYDCAEPRHVHVEKEDRLAKYWLEPVRQERATGYKASEIRQMEELIHKHLAALSGKWDEHCAKQ